MAQRCARCAGGVWPAVAAAAAQVQTEVPPPVAGAKPVTVERIKVHGAALEGNLEGNAVDRDVLVFLPPELREGEVAALPGRLRAARLLDRRRAVERARSTCRRPSRAPSRRARSEMIVVLPDSKTRAQRLDVFELGDRRRLRAVRRARSGRLRRRALPDAGRTATAAASSATRWAATARRASA